MSGYQLKITIKGSKPPIWRRVIVPDRITFKQLHQVIQAIFGWGDMHLHEFEIRGIGVRFVDPATAEDEDDMFWFPGRSETYGETQRIDEWLPENPRIVYTYDFGDDWEHQIVLEKTVEYPYRYPTVVKYKGDNLPEDCGGIWGYYELLENLEAGGPQREELEDWARGQGMRPFDLEDVNELLQDELVFSPAKGRKRTQKGRKKKTDEPDMEEIGKFLNEMLRQSRAQSGAESAEEKEAPSDRLQDIFYQYEKKYLAQLAKRQKMKGFSSLSKAQLAARLADHVLTPQVMKPYFLCASDGEIATFEAFAEKPGVPHEIEEEDLSYLQDGGYCAWTEDLEVVVPAEVARAYREINTEEFKKRRKRVYKIWTYISAAMYFYGVCTDEQITAVFNLLEDELLGEPELHGVYRDVKDLRCSFVYENGLFMDEALVEGKDYLEVLKCHEGIWPFIPTRQMVSEIGEVGACEMDRQMIPMVEMFQDVFGAEHDLAIAMAYQIHHMMRYGADARDVSDLMGDYEVKIDSQEKEEAFKRVMESVWRHTRMIGYNGHTLEEIEQMEAEQDGDRPCPCGSGKKYRQCCGRKKRGQ